jgi:hypothetical protein
MKRLLAHLALGAGLASSLATSAPYLRVPASVSAAQVQSAPVRVALPAPLKDGSPVVLRVRVDVAGDFYIVNRDKSLSKVDVAEEASLGISLLGPWDLRGGGDLRVAAAAPGTLDEAHCSTDIWGDRTTIPEVCGGAAPPAAITQGLRVGEDTDFLLAIGGTPVLDGELVLQVVVSSAPGDQVRFDDVAATLTVAVVDLGCPGEEPAPWDGCPDTGTDSGDTGVDAGDTGADAGDTGADTSTPADTGTPPDTAVFDTASSADTSSATDTGTPSDSANADTAAR